jgi:formate dehydrogenase major subunit
MCACAPGTDIPVIWGMMWHIFQNGWEDKEFINQRVYGMDDGPQRSREVEPRRSRTRLRHSRRAIEARRREVCEGEALDFHLVHGRHPAHGIGTANVRSFCILLLATGQVGGMGVGANIFRGHCNVQGATDLGLDVGTLPLYYGIDRRRLASTGAASGRPTFEWMQGSFRRDEGAGRQGNPKMMGTAGIPSTRWFDAATLPKDQVAQRDNVKAMMVFGHGGNTVTRMPKAAEGIERLELMVVADPHPTTWAVLSERKNDTYLLPICTQFECAGSRTASNRSLQWYEKIVDPIFESKTDYEVMYLLAKKLGIEDRMFKNIKVENNKPLAEDILREINRGGWSTGYCGQSPERLKAHMRNQDKFDLVTLRAPKDTPEVGGDYYGLPWPCWGTPEIRHPGTHQLYNTHLHVKDGGGTFRARFGVEREEKLADGTTRKVSLLANGSYSQGSEIQDGYPEFNYGVLKKLGWDGDLTEAERTTIERIGGANPDGVSWATDLSGGIQRVCLEHGVIHYGNGKARANAWNLPDPVPTHREPIYTPRPDLVAKYPTYPDAKAQFRVPNIGFTIQKEAVDKGIAKQFPLICTSGRLVEYEGGGEETRSNKWLAELQQDSFIEINPADAAERGITDGQWCLVMGPEMPAGRVCRVKALVTERVGRGTTWMPFHFAGWFMNVDQRSKYPQGTDPIVLGESVNIVTGYGFDPVNRHARTQSDALPSQGGVRRRHHGSNEIPL